MLARVSRMDWAEVRVRTLQEFHKQRDLLIHRMGVRRDAVRLNGDFPVRPGRFFFSGIKDSGIDGSGSARAELLVKHLPEEAAEILREADEICGHRFRLLGYDNLDFTPGPTAKFGDGNFKGIDWNLDPVHGKRVPLDPWFKIPFLDFAAVGDHKVIWELNRHQHLVTLAKARLLSGDNKYVRELIAQWHSWVEANPYPLGINWGSTLEVAIRSLSWIWIDQLLAGSGGYEEFHPQLLPALAFHGLYIERYLSAYFSPNTHLLGEALALLFLGTLYPQFPRAAHWREFAWKIVVHEADRQVRPDGVYFEQSLYYHVYALDFFLYARLLRARNGMEIPAAYDAVLGRMLDVVAALAQAGPAEGFGDDDGGRLWNPRRNRTEHMTDPLALGAMIYSRDFLAAQLTEEAIWLFGSESVNVLSQKPETQTTATAVRSVAFRDGGIFVLADRVLADHVIADHVLADHVLADSEPYAQALVVDAGPQGMGRAGHGHADALSMRLAMDGRRWLVDAGSGVYISEDPANRNAFRGTGAHNTLRVDQLDQAVPDGPFSWTHIPETAAEKWIAGKTFTYFVGSHDGYARLPDPVVHRRHILQIAGGMCLVRDIALGRSEHEIDIRWHFASDLEVRRVGARSVEMSTAGAAQGGARLSLIMPEEANWPAAMDVTTTLVSPAYGKLQAAPLVQCHGRVLLPVETATALVAGRVVRQKDELHGEPFVESLSDPLSEPLTDRLTDPVTELRLTSVTEGAVQAYELDYHPSERHASERHGFFFALADSRNDNKSKSNDAWSFGGWCSDAGVLYCRIENEKLAQLVAIGGTHVAWRGRRLMQAEGRFEFFEWCREGGVMSSAPAGLRVTSSFEELPEELPSFSSMSTSSSEQGSSDAASSQSLPSRAASRYAEKH